MDQMVRAERAIIAAVSAKARDRVAGYVDQQPPCAHARGYYQFEAELYCRDCDQIKP